MSLNAEPTPPIPNRPLSKPTDLGQTGRRPVSVPPDRRIVMWGLVVAMGLCGGGCIEDLVQSVVDQTVSKHLEGIGDDGDVDASGKPRQAGGKFKIPRPMEPTGKVAASSQTDACRADLAAGLEKIKVQHGLAIAVGKEQVDALAAEGKVTIQYARDGVKHRPGFGLQKTEAGCDLRFYRRETIKPGHMESATANYGSAPLTQCVCE